MKPTLALMTVWFGELNRSVFGGELLAVKLATYNTRRQLGQFYWGGGRGLGIKIPLIGTERKTSVATAFSTRCATYIATTAGGLMRVTAKDGG